MATTRKWANQNVDDKWCASNRTHTYNYKDDYSWVELRLSWRWRFFKMKVGCLQASVAFGESCALENFRAPGWHWTHVAPNICANLAMFIVQKSATSAQVQQLPWPNGKTLGCWLSDSEFDPHQARLGDANIINKICRNNGRSALACVRKALPAALQSGITCNQGIP